ncbi:MAG: murein biosynthesis integral membrane protein MurJ [Planctomycetota bacterium]
MSHTANHSILRSAGVVGITTLASRVLGLARDMATTAVLGGLSRDALLLAWTIPNLLRRLFGEGALSSALVPVFSQVRADHGLARALSVGRGVVTRLTVFLTGVLVLIIALTYLLPGAWLVGLFESEEKAALCLRLLRIFLPYLVIVCVLAQLGGILNCLGRFFVPAVAPALLNATWVVAALIAGLWPGLSDGVRATWIAVAILGGGFVQFAVTVVDLRPFGAWMRPSAEETADVRRVFVTMAPLLVGLAASQLNVLVDRLVAEGLVAGDGAVTHLYVAQRMIQFPLGLVSIAISTAAFPHFARLVATNDRAGLASTLFGSMRSGLFLSVPAFVGLLLLADPIMELLFLRGEFTQANTAASARALVAYAAGIPFLTATMLLVRAYYALNRYRTAVTATLVSVAFNIVADFILVYWMQETGIALATSLAALVQTAILLPGLVTPESRRPALQCLREFGATLAASLLMTGAILGGLYLVDSWEMSHGTVERLVRVSLPMTIGIVVFGIAARWLAPESWRELLGLVQRRARRRFGGAAQERASPSGGSACGAPLANESDLAKDTRE